MTGPARLADVLNTVFDAGVTTAAEARDWLRGGGWQVLDSWIASRRSAKNDPTPEERAEIAMRRVALEAEELFAPTGATHDQGNTRPGEHHDRGNIAPGAAL